MEEPQLGKSVKKKLTVVLHALEEPANHPVFEGGAPEFNRGGCGYEACEILREVLRNT